MAAITPGTSPAADGADFHGRQRPADRAFEIAALGAGLLVLFVLGGIALTTTTQAWPAFDHMGLDFFTSARWVGSQELFGARNLIGGSLITAAIAVILAVPVSLGIALFTTQVATDRVRKWIVAVVDLLAVIPSVIFGLFAILFLAPKILGFYENLHSWFDSVPILGRLFGEPNGSKNLFTAGVVLAVMITPIITSLSREIIDTTPRTDREAAFGLGATRWEMIRGAVLPHSESRHRRSGDARTWAGARRDDRGCACGWWWYLCRLESAATWRHLALTDSK